MAPKPEVKPYVFEVHIAQQIVKVKIGSRTVYQCQCIAGDKDNPTKRGKHVIYDKDRYHTSSKYGSKMDFAMFFYKGQALHQYHGLGWFLLYNAKKGTDLIGSHGCVRLQRADAEKLFNWAVEYKTEVHVL